MNRDLLNVAIEDGVDQEAASQLREVIAFFGDDADFHAVPDRGPQASILLLGFTSVALIFGGAFIKKLGDKAAEDCYPHIKRALLGVYKKYFGPNASYQVKVISSSENKMPETPYSLILALYCVGRNNEKVKFLYRTDWTQEEFEEATERYLESMVDFVGKGQGVVAELVQEEPVIVQPYLIAMDASSGRLVRVNALPEGVGI